MPPMPTSCTMRCCGSPVCTAAEVAQRAAGPELLAQLAAQPARDAPAAPGATRQLWVTAERLPLFSALFPQARLRAAGRDAAGARADARAPRQRSSRWCAGGCEGCGPDDRRRRSRRTLGLPAARIEAALAALQAEGFAMRGAFTRPPPGDGEWCERRLLARIHRYTVKRLRAEIEPVEARDFLRFLLRVAARDAPPARMEGPDAVGAILAQLEGFEAPASAWETEILPRAHQRVRARPGSMSSVSPAASCGRGSRRARSDPERARRARCAPRPIVLLARRNLRLWSRSARARDAAAPRRPARSASPSYLGAPRRLVLR